MSYTIYKREIYFTGLIANQEDSLLVNKSAVERGLFDGSKFTFYRTEFEQKEELGNPDASKTDGLKSANYEKLFNGIVQKGAIIKQNDVLIGKYMPYPGESDRYVYLDRSIVYKEKEDAIVHNVIVNRNEDGTRFCKVSLRKVRPVSVGDKFCVTDDHECLTQTGWKSIADVTLDDRVATLGSAGQLEWNYPTKLYKFAHQGQMYEVDNGLISLKTTLNHKMYVKISDEYSLTEAKNIMGKRVHYKRDCYNHVDDVEEFILPDSDRKLPMNEFLCLLGIYLANGYVDCAGNVIIDIEKPTVKKSLNRIANTLQIDTRIYESDTKFCYIKDRAVNDYLSKFVNGRVPQWCFLLSKAQTRILLNGMLLCKGYNADNYWIYRTDRKRLANNIQLLSILSEQTATITHNENYRVYIHNDTDYSEPVVNHANETLIDDFDGTVYCIEVPNHVFMIRRNKKYCWTGNSSRAG